MEEAASALEQGLRALRPVSPVRPAVQPHSPDAPTPKQGQFLAYIRDYQRLNPAGLAPTHAELQRFFGLTPPSVNSMLIRLEQRGFIERIPGKARAIHLTIDPALIPELDRPFKL